MQMRNNYFKPENKTDNSDFTIFGMKIGPVPDLQELSSNLSISLIKIHDLSLLNRTWSRNNTALWSNNLQV